MNVQIVKFEIVVSFTNFTSHVCLDITNTTNRKINETKNSLAIVVRKIVASEKN